MKIHFVCTGNTFRSRIAEAYLKSKLMPGIDVSSSGIEAKINLSGSITWYAKDILDKRGLLQFTKKSWDQTTKQQLEEQDLVVFMSQTSFEYCKNKLHFAPIAHLVWNIDDVGDALSVEELQSNTIISKFVEANYIVITKKVDDLIEQIQGGKIEIPSLS